MSIRFLSGVNIDSNTLFVDSTNNRVGIGTAEPTGELHIYGSQPAFRIQSSVSGNMQFGQWDTTTNRIQSSGRNFYLVGTDDYDTIFGTNNSEKMRIKSGGNVLIGTTTDGGQKLQVNGEAALAINSGGIIVRSYDGDTGNIRPSAANGSVLISDDSGTAGRGTEFLNNGGFTASTTSSLISSFNSSVQDGLVYTRVTATQQTTSSGSSPAAIELVGLRESSTHGRHVWIGAEGVTSTTYRTKLLFKIRGENNTGYQWSGASEAPTIMTLDGNGYVGIGTSSPSTTLGVHGQVRFNTTNADGNENRLFFNPGGAGDPAQLYLYNEAQTNTIYITANGTSFFNGGNVLIGTITDTGYKLFVSGTGKVASGNISISFLENPSWGSNVIKTDMSSSAVAHILGQDNSTNNSATIRFYYAGAASNDNYVGLGFYGNDDLLRVLPTGKVRLTQYGSGSVTGTATYGLAVDSSGNVIEVTSAIDGSGTANYVTKWQDSNTLTNSIIRDDGTTVGVGVSPSAWNTVTALQVGSASLGGYSYTGYINSNAFYQTGWKYINSSYAARYEINQSNAGIHAWYTAPSGTAGDAISFTEVMRIDASGNVGIGTTSPSAKLDVIGTGVFGTMTTSRGSYSNGLSLQNDGGQATSLFLWQNGVASAHIGSPANSTSLHIVNSYNTGSITDSNAIVLTNTGNVGIGTTNPGAKLEVDSASTLPIIRARYNASYYTDYDSNGIQFVGTGQNFNITDNGSSVLYLKSGGNVGIGTTSPSSKLHVSGDSYVTGQFAQGVAVASKITGYGAEFRSSSASAQIFFGRSGDSVGSGGIGADETSTFIVWSVPSFVKLLVVNQNGNVGINTDAPSQKLHVVGDARVTGAYYDSNNEAGTSGQVLTSTGSGTDWKSLSEITGVDGTGTANYVAKWSDTDTITNSQIFDNGTNVGINNASPKTKLDVNGAIGFGSKSMSMTDTFAAALTVNMNDHNGCYVKITAFGDWANHSTIAYLGEFFLQASAGAYNEPGIIIRQVDNTAGGDDIQAQIVDPAGTGTRDFVIQLKSTSSANTPFTAVLQYEVRGMYNSVS